jgi:hypothetical protein
MAKMMTVSAGTAPEAPVPRDFARFAKAMYVTQNSTPDFDKNYIIFEKGIQIYMHI